MKVKAFIKAKRNKILEKTANFTSFQRAFNLSKKSYNNTKQKYKHNPLPSPPHCL